MRRLAVGLGMACLVASSAWAETPAEFAKTILDIHNRERAAVSVPPLVWSDKLAADAKPWAEHLATLGKLVHAPPKERGDEGEDLWMGSAGGYATAEKVEGWAAEKKDWHGGPFRVRGPGEPVIGHYTQMVWRTTTAIGCATAGAGAWDYLVCRYAPAGNLVGQAPY
jgi:cysteine-rich secretory family protein